MTRNLRYAGRVAIYALLLTVYIIIFVEVPQVLRAALGGSVDLTGSLTSDILTWLLMFAVFFTVIYTVIYLRFRSVPLPPAEPRYIRLPLSLLAGVGIGVFAAVFGSGVMLHGIPSAAMVPAAVMYGIAIAVVSAIFVYFGSALFSSPPGAKPEPRS